MFEDVSLQLRTGLQAASLMTRRVCQIISCVVHSCCPASCLYVSAAARCLTCC